jgi:signal transduction histidine kinase
MTVSTPASSPGSPASLRRWLAAHSWMPTWQPTRLRHPFFSYALAVVAVAIAVALTHVLELALTSFSFHGMIGYFAILCIAVIWGVGPALLAAAVGIGLLSFLVEPPGLASIGGRPVHDMSHAVSFVLSFAFGIAVSLIAGQAERRRRMLADDLAAIQDLEQLRDRMLTTVTHDLRNPLTSISGMSQILQLRVGQLDEPVRERFAHCLRTIEAAACRMTAQINDLLDAAQLQSGRPLDLSLQPTEIVAFLQQILDEHQRSTERHTLALQASDAAIDAMIDPHRLQRVMANLLVNAIKYSPQGGPIVIFVAKALGPDGRWLSISVADRGLGIPSADLPHMFEQYYRASNVAATIPGTGIGLANVRHAIERHGGSIAIDSTEGTGTTVTVRLPLLPVGEARATPPLVTTRHR